MAMGQSYNNKINEEKSRLQVYEQRYLNFVKTKTVSLDTLKSRKSYTKMLMEYILG